MPDTDANRALKLKIDQEIQQEMAALKSKKLSVNDAKSESKSTKKRKCERNDDSDDKPALSKTKKTGRAVETNRANDLVILSHQSKVCPSQGLGEGNLVRFVF